MNQLVAFDFESHNVRVSVDALGRPWFVAADVCEALCLPETHKAVGRLDADEKDRNSIPTPGGLQEMTVINEAGLYNLILGSRKSQARRFKRWVTHEVLPSIRKTGMYAIPGPLAALPAPTQDRVGALLLIGEAVARVPGVKAGIAMAATLTAIHENTGMALEALRKVLPAANEPLASLNPTQLGKELRISAKALNLRLQQLGLQCRNDRDEWELTDAGKTHGEALPFSRNGHSGYQILWQRSVVDLVKEAA